MVEKAKKKLDEHITYLKRQNQKVDYTLIQFESYRKMLDNKSLHDKYFDQFVDITKKLDKIRNPDVKHYLSLKNTLWRKMSKRIISYLEV